MLYQRKACACGCGQAVFGRRDKRYVSASHRKRASMARTTRNKPALPRCAYCHQNPVSDTRAKYCCKACKQAAYRFRLANGNQTSF